MAVQFVLGRAGAGKTEHCLRALLAELEKRNETRRLILLAPEQATFQMERALALRARGGGYWRAEVLSFSRLARRILDELGAATDEIRPAARQLALRRIVTSVPLAREAFGRAATTPGFFKQLSRLIEELIQANVAPAALRDGCDALSPRAKPRVAAVTAVYAAYLDWLGESTLDPAQRQERLRAWLERCTWLRDASIWVDGFAGFTEQEFETLVALTRGARDVTITLLLDPTTAAADEDPPSRSQLDLFATTLETRYRLERRVRDAGVKLPAPATLTPPVMPRFARAPGIARLETALCGGSPSDAQHDRGDVRVVECATHLDEVRRAAGFIRGKVLDSAGALRFHDFALICRSLDPFAHLVSKVFDEFEIPYFLDQRRPLISHALPRALRALFDALREDFSVATLSRLLRGGLLPMSREHASQLENFATRHVVRGWREWRKRRWEFTEERRGKPPLRSSPPKELEQDRLALVAALDPLVELARRDQAASGSQWAETLYETLVALGAPERIEQWRAAARADHDLEAEEIHRLAWDAVVRVLDDMHDVLSDTALRAGEFGSLLSGVLSDESIGLAPPALNQVLVASIERSRHPDIKFAWVVGFNEGLFPETPGDDALLNSEERRTLAERGIHGLKSRRERVFAERLLAYVALTRPSEGLVISHALMDNEGAPLAPSRFLRDLRSALPSLSACQATDAAPPACLADAARAHLTTQRDSDPSRRTRLKRLIETLEQSPITGERLRGLLRGQTYQNKPAALGELVRPAPDGAWSISHSELESFLRCPFKHFAQYGLGLRAALGPKPLHMDLGSAAHAMLAGVYRRVIDAKCDVRAMSDAQWLEDFERVADEYIDAHMSDWLKFRAEDAFRVRLLKTFAAEVVLAHADRYRRGIMTPIVVERVFRDGAGPHAWPAVELSIAGKKKIHLHGIIDRVDCCEIDGVSYWLVYDYKSSTGDTIRNYLVGYPLQLFTYLLAVRTPDAAAAVKPGGVLIAPLYPALGAPKPKYAQNADACKQRMYLYRPRGMFDHAVAAALEQAPSGTPSPVANIRVTNKGEFYKNSDTGTEFLIEAYLDVARQTIAQAAEGLLKGCIDISPLVEEHTLACTRCDFRALCRFENELPAMRNTARHLPQLSAADGDKK